MANLVADQPDDQSACQLTNISMKGNVLDIVHVGGLRGKITKNRN